MKKVIIKREEGSNGCLVLFLGMEDVSDRNKVILAIVSFCRLD